MPFVSEAMEGFQGETRFFATAMKWGELQQMAVFPDELGEEFGQDEDRLQRGLVRSRLAPLISYLIDIPDHFFSALTLIILPRTLESPASESIGSGDADERDDWDFYFERAHRQGPGRTKTGVIHLSAGARLFPADGQHRLRAALDAIQLEPALAREEVPVVLVPYLSREQVGQLFSDLNLNAKPVNKSVGYSFESRNAVVLIAKKVIAEVPLFQDRIQRGSNSLPKSSANVITMSGLVEGTRVLLSSHLDESERSEATATSNRKFASAQERWAAEHPAEAFQFACSMWRVITQAFDQQWAPVIHGEHRAAGTLRDEYVFPHGLGWSALTLAAAELRRQRGLAWEGAFRDAVLAIDWRRANPEWEGCATVRGAVMNTAQNVRATAQFILRSAPS